jgi:hypothetical protein
MPTKLHPPANLLQLKQDPATAVDIMYQYGAWLTTGSIVVILHRYQIQILHAHLGLYKKEGNPPSAEELIKAVDGILMPASKDDVNGYKRGLRKLFERTLNNKLLEKKMVETLKPKTEPVISPIPVVAPDAPKSKRKLDWSHLKKK